MKLRLIVFLSLCVFGFGLSANAGTIADTDSDSVPDVFDNCSAVANGPAAGANGNQVDGDSPTDGYGNQCDGDLTGDGLVGGTDFGAFVGLFGSAGTGADLTGDGLVGGTDFGAFVGLFGSVPGPSGLSCAGTAGCL
jgi:hypothetical protein